MRNLTDQLRSFVDDAPRKRESAPLTAVEERLFRMLKTTGERATKGRLVCRTRFEAKENEGMALLMIMEGRHSMSVGRQVARRFDNVNELKFAEVHKTPSGACVILRARETANA